MKKLLLIVIFIFTGLYNYAQTDGISYQAVIIDPNGIELPGVDSDGNILPNAKISIRFTILDATNSEEYQEVQTTETDLFGRINLIIGNQNPDTFALIDWDGTAKDLKVEIDFKGTGSSFVDMSREKLTFIPFSYHRNILARGTLTVDDTTDLNGELKVQGPTNLNSTLNVNNNNDTNLSGQLNVEGVTNLKSNFAVEGVTTFNDSISVNAKSNFAGNMQVTADAVFEGKMEFKSEEPANFNSMVVKDSINVEGPSNLNGQVTVLANIGRRRANQNVFNDYAMKVLGREQGIAIKLKGIDNDDPTVRTDVPLSGQNNFISFWDEDEDKMWGRIEGQSAFDLKTDYQFERERVRNALDVTKAVTSATIAGLTAGFSVAEVVGALSSATGCVGVGACVTLPIPSLIASKLVKTIIKWADVALILIDLGLSIENVINFEATAFKHIGVTYSSGAGDYAEWLPKQNTADVFSPRELVGIKNGLVTKNTWGVEKIMIVSTNPIVLGNMPQQNDDKNNVKIAFMGQVPVNVLGKVSPGDYILPNELGGGFGKAVNPKDMKTRDYKKVAGVAWKVIEEITDGLSIVNVAVGINTNDLTETVARQEEEIKALQEVFNQLNTQISESNTVLANLVPGYTEALGNTKDVKISSADNAIESKDKKNIENNIYYPQEGDIIYFEISNEQIETAITMAREQYVELLNDQNQLNKIFLTNKGELKDTQNDIVLLSIKDHPFWKKIDNDPTYKKEIIQVIQSGMEKTFHTHKKYAHKFTHLKVRNN